MKYAIDGIAFIVAWVLVALFEAVDLQIRISIWHSLVIVIIVFALAGLPRFLSRRRISLGR